MTRAPSRPHPAPATASAPLALLFLPGFLWLPFSLDLHTPSSLAALGLADVPVPLWVLLRSSPSTSPLSLKLPPPGLGHGLDDMDPGTALLWRPARTSCTWVTLGDPCPPGVLQPSVLPRRARGASDSTSHPHPTKALSHLLSVLSGGRRRVQAWRVALLTDSPPALGRDP